MAIQEITDVEAIQRCAKCDGENHLLLDELEVGVEIGEGQVQDSIVPLPGCPACHAREFLMRSPQEEQEHSMEAGAVRLHRLLVDELHAELVKRGRVVERLRGKVDQILTRPIAAEARARHFGTGLCMPPAAVEGVEKEMAK